MGNETIETLSVKISHYILGAVAIVSAIAWNTAIRNLVERYFPAPEDALLGSFVYAVLITATLILLIYALPDTTPELPNRARTRIRNHRCSRAPWRRECRVDQEH